MRTAVRLPALLIMWFVSVYQPGAFCFRETSEFEPNPDTFCLHSVQELSFVRVTPRFLIDLRDLIAHINLINVLQVHIRNYLITDVPPQCIQVRNNLENYT